MTDLSADRKRVMELEAAIQTVIAGDVPRPVAHPSKNDRCKHDRWLHQNCEWCVADFLRTALKGPHDR